MRIGITERGDAGIDFGWVQKLSTVDGAIIITKNVAFTKFQDAILNPEVQKKIILHATVTGNGGTIYEPNTPPCEQSIEAIRNLIDNGFDQNRIVLRVDPIIPTNDSLKNTYVMLNAALDRIPEIKRIRVSILDNYPHVKQRWVDAGLQPLYNGNFYPSQADTDRIVKMLDYTIGKSESDIAVEACAENRLSVAAKQLQALPIQNVGCVSYKDLKILGLEMPDDIGINNQHRSGCLCLNCKTELLTSRSRCPNKCLYCYWKD